MPGKMRRLPWAESRSGPLGWRASLRRKKRVRIAVLTWVEEEGAHLDPVVEQVLQALRRKGHEAWPVAVYDDLRGLIAKLSSPRPDLVFNLMEMFAEDVTTDIAIAGLLELLDLPYTGGGPGELYLAQDKALGKKLLAFEKIRYPNFAVFYPDAGLETGGSLRFPLFVKPMRADASIGIDDRSLVRDSKGLMEAVARIHSEVGDAALAEEFIEGRELYVGVLGNREPIAFPPLEMEFSGSDGPNVLDQAAKWERGTEQYEGTKAKVADLPDAQRARLQQVAIAACRALKVRDYARVDLRVTPTDEIFVLEVNANCYLERRDEFAFAAKEAGIEYDDLIERIVALALERERVRRPEQSAADSVGESDALTDAP